MNWQATAGRPYGLCVDYNLILTVNYHISTTIQRRQQATALPCRRLLRIFRNSLWGCLSLTMQLLLFRKNHARLACSVVNALTTAHCRYQLLRFADRFKPRGKKICKKQKADGLKSSSAFWCERRNLNAKLRLPFTATIICSFCSATLRKRWTNGFKSRGKCVGKNKKQTN